MSSGVNGWPRHARDRARGGRRHCTLRRRPASPAAATPRKVA